MYIIFNNDRVIYAGDIIPSSHTGDEYVRAELPNGEVFDPTYSYTVVDGKAIKGSAIPPDLEEESRIEAEFVATQYSRDRKAKYDQLNQDEMRFDDLVNNTTTWVDTINAIKAAHPKP